MDFCQARPSENSKQTHILPLVFSIIMIRIYLVHQMQHLILNQQILIFFHEICSLLPIFSCLKINTFIFVTKKNQDRRLGVPSDDKIDFYLEIREQPKSWPVCPIPASLILQYLLRPFSRIYNVAAYQEKNNGLTALTYYLIREVRLCMIATHFQHILCKQFFLKYILGIGS